MDLDDVEGSLEKAYREQFGEQRSRTNMDESTIRPSTVPDELPQIDEQDYVGRTVVIKEHIPECLKRVSKRKMSESSEDDDEDESDTGGRSWRPSGRPKKELDPPIVTMFDLSSEEEEEVVGAVVTAGRTKPQCPVVGCDTVTRKLRNHVNRFHLPKIMWDNHQPPVRPEKEDEMNRERFKVLKFLARKLVKSEDLQKLLDYCTEEHLIPQRSINTRRTIQQMRSLTDTMKWRSPPYHFYALYPPNHTAVMIHWRYQVGLLKKLSSDDAREYAHMGREFMNDPDNFLVRKRCNRSGETILSRSLHDPTVRTTQSMDDQNIRIVVETRLKDPQTDNMYTMDVVGEPEDVRVVVEKEEEKITMDVVGEPEEMTVTNDFDEETAVVTIGDATYTLVYKGSSLVISSDHRRLANTSRETRAPTNKYPAYAVFDSHLHLDRTSKRLLGNLTLTLEEWLQEPMERPPCTPVNVIGGTLIFCDPDTYPTSVPVDDRWRLAVGVHPKHIGRTFNPAQMDRFLELIRSERVSAIGEVGLDRTVKGKYWDDQSMFLREILPEVKKLGKPLILHIRSLPTEPFFQSTYLSPLKLCHQFLSSKHSIILHCFTSTKEIVEAWLYHFPNTFFGITYCVSKFKSEQRRALRAIPNNRLLVETDSPYIAPRGVHNNSPLYVGEVVLEVARIRGQSVQEVCRWTTHNAAVFGLRL